MCDPITIAGVALSGAAAAANGMAASKVAKARGEVLSAERARQKSLDAEAAALNVQSQDRYQGFEGQQGERGKALGDYFKQQRTEAPTGAAMTEGDITAPTSGSNITVKEEQKQRGKAATATDAQAEALGGLRAFGDVLGSTGRLQARDANRIGQIGGFKKGSSDVSALELDAANGAGNGLKSIGGILGTLGSAATGYGLMGSFTGAASAAANPFAAGAGGYAGAGPFIQGNPAAAASGAGGGLNFGGLLKGIFG